MFNEENNWCLGKKCFIMSFIGLFKSVYLSDLKKSN